MAKVKIVDLRKIEGEGDFLCPNCKQTISPEDESEENYSILEAKVKGEKLTEILLQCKCKQKIKLIGF